MRNPIFIQLRLLSRSTIIYEKMKYLCVAEKNDAAKTISGFLSRGNSQRREGLSKYNKIYEFDMDLKGAQTRIVFTSVSGHLLTYDFGGAFRNWKGCSPEQLFDAPVIKTCPENFIQIKNTLEREIRSCNGLVIWTDCDREGENIGFEIIDVCRAIKPSIVVHRAKFSDMTSTSIYRAINNLQVPNALVSQAVDVRSELDLRIGAAFTRFQTLRLQQIFPEHLANDLVSYGSCQIPTLGFVADRYREIEKFISTTFWKIKLTHRVNNLTVEYNWDRNRLFDKDCCEALLMMCRADGTATVTNVQQKPKNKWRPQPMDTIELEKTGSKKLRMSAKAIMTIAEKLYTQGFISYPRTETNKFPPTMNLRSIVEMQTQHGDWGDFAQKVLEWGPNPRNGNKSDQAHPPIHPTKFTNTLNGDEKRVYELVVRHFLACVSKDAVGSETVVNITIGNEDFHATGLVILERNYLEVYIYDKWSGKEIHKYEIGDTFTPTELGLHEGKTNPPSLLTEADLIALMEKHGIGTDATHAEHIATIKDRGYIGEAERGQLVPGMLGMGLVEGYELMNLTLAQPQLRAGLELDLKAICDGLKDPQTVLREQIEKYKNCYQVIANEVTALDRAVGNRFGQEPQAIANDNAVIPAAAQELFKCPKCRQSSMVVRQKKDNTGSFISCQGYPQCKNAIWLTYGVKELESTNEICGNCGGQNHKVKIKFSQISMMGMVDEVEAFSRIDGTYYITCLLCDAKIRDILRIPIDQVKVVGNVVSAAAAPVVQSSLFGSNQQNRGISNNANNSVNQQNWGSANIANNSANQRPTSSWGITREIEESLNSSTHNRSNWFSNNNSNQQPGTSSSAPRPNDVLKNLPDCLCECKMTALKLMCRKEGPNTNRAFYKCKSGVCKFFHWADRPLPTGITISRTTAKPSSSGPRKCGICRMPGHTKKNCPNG